MSVFQSIFLGIVQGLTEFLPVSSSGHLVVFQSFLGLKEHSLSFDIAAHLGTLLSILTIYRVLLKSLVIDSIRTLRTQQWTSQSKLVLLVVIASVPTALMGFLLKDFFESLFNSLQAVAGAFLVTGLILFLTRFNKQKKIEESMQLSEVHWPSLNLLTPWKAFLIGVAQGCAITPGISRSGSTIAVGILLGVPRDLAALFSFIMSIPAIVGAALLQFRDFSWATAALEPLVIGFVTSYATGLLGLWLILKVVRQGKLEYFSLYLWLLGAGLLFIKI